MNALYNIYLFCYVEGKPLDFLLPVCSAMDFQTQHETAGSCFKIYNPENAQVLLGCKHNDVLYTVTVDIHSACVANANISFTIIVNEEDDCAWLRAFTDAEHNGSYPLPDEFIKLAKRYIN